MGRTLLILSHLGVLVMNYIFHCSKCLIDTMDELVGSGHTDISNDKPTHLLNTKPVCMTVNNYFTFLFTHELSLRVLFPQSSQ